MDTNTRSYVSRFSGLLLFLLTLLVVGVLVILTVRAARDNDSTAGIASDTSEVVNADDDANGRDFIIDGGDGVDLSIDSSDDAVVDSNDSTDFNVSVDANNTNDADVTVDSNDADDASVSVATDNTDSSDDSNGVVATGDEDQNTDTNDSAVAGATDGEDSESDTDESADSSEETPTTVAITGGAELPNTGAGETTLGVIFVSAMLLAYFGSRRDLIAALKS